MARSGDSLDWDDLRYFLHAARSGTLAGAARSLGVEHSTIGRRLSALESSMGVSLMLRGPSGLSLTPLGEKVVPLLDEVERAVVALTDLVANEKARVRLAIPSGFMRLFTPALPRLRRLHPGLSLELVSGARPADLERGEADLAIRAGPIRDKDLIARKIGVSGWSLYASQDYLDRRPLADDLDGLVGHDVVGFDPALAGSVGARWLAEHGSRATVVLRSREMTDMVAAAASGVGMALLPCPIAETEPSLRRVVPGIVASHSLSLVSRREARRSDNVRAVVAFIVELFGEHAARISGVAED